METTTKRLARAACMPVQRMTQILDRLPPFDEDATFAEVLHRVRREAAVLRREEAREAYVARLDEEAMRMHDEMRMRSNWAAKEGGANARSA